MSHVPSLVELDRLNCSKNCLLLLRVLNTSDFTFFYMLFKTETLDDIVDNASSLVHEEFATLEDGEEPPLTPEETAEFEDLCNDLRRYSDWTGSVLNCKGN